MDSCINWVGSWSWLLYGSDRGGGITIYCNGAFLRFKERLGQYFLEVDLFIVLESPEAYHRLLIYCSQENIGIYNINSRIEDEELLDYPGHSSEDTCCILSINLQERYRKQILVETLSTFDGVKHLEEL